MANLRLLFALKGKLPNLRGQRAVSDGAARHGVRRRSAARPDA